MATNIIDEYLVRLGCSVDKPSFGKVDGVLKDLGKKFTLTGKLMAGAFASAIAAITALTVGIPAAGRAFGNITSEVDRMALSLHTTTRNARNLQAVMDAMGIKSLDDLKYTNLIPEQRKQFMELRKLAAQNAPSAYAMGGISEIRKLGFEFQKFTIRFTGLSNEFMGGLGNVLKEPLFKKVPYAIDTLLDLLAITANTVVFIGKSIGRYKNFGQLNSKGYDDLGKFVRKKLLGTEKKAENWGELFHQIGGNKKEYQSFAIKAAQKYKIDPAILMAQINQESGWNPKAKSKAGALGIAQFMPGTAKGLGINPLNPYQSIEAAAKWHKNMLIHYHGNQAAALASYNAGQGAVDSSLRRTGRIPKYRETQGYVNSIQSQADKIRNSGILATQNVSTMAGKAEYKGMGGVSGGFMSQNVTIHINGAKDPAATGKEAAKHIERLSLKRNAAGFS